MRSIKRMFGVFVLSMAALVAASCSEESEALRANEDCGSSTPETMVLLQKFTVAKMAMGLCTNLAIANHAVCNSAAHDQSERDACQDLYLTSYHLCDYGRSKMANDAMADACGGKIFVLDSDTNPKTYVSAFIDEDQDGDGVKNKIEWLMNISPCTTHTAGSCHPSDGDQDYDGDGIPNKLDPKPLCNPARPDEIGCLQD